jgi:type II secretory pathway component GspD/PulD (secretin)
VEDTANSIAVAGKQAANSIDTGQEVDQNSILAVSAAHFAAAIRLHAVVPHWSAAAAAIRLLHAVVDEPAAAEAEEGHCSAAAAAIRLAVQEAGHSAAAIRLLAAVGKQAAMDSNSNSIAVAGSKQAVNSIEQAANSIEQAANSIDTGREVDQNSILAATEAAHFAAAIRLDAVVGEPEEGNCSAAANHPLAV